MKLRTVAVVSSWFVLAAVVAPLGRDSFALTGIGLALSGLFVLAGLRGRGANEFSLAAVTAALTYVRSVVFADGTDGWGPVVAVALVAFLAASTAFGDGALDVDAGYWQARRRTLALWLLVTVAASTITAAAGALSTDRPHNAWLVGLAATLALFAVVVSGGRVRRVSSSEGP